MIGWMLVLAWIGDVVTFGRKVRNRVLWSFMHGDWTFGNSFCSSAFEKTKTCGLRYFLYFGHVLAQHRALRVGP